MELNVGDVFWLEVTYPKTTETETRPVVIYDFDGDNPIFASFATITGEGISDFNHKYDKWKSPIFGWESAGLSKKSYVKVNNIATASADAFKRRNYIGKLTNYDLLNAIRKINDFLESGEEPW